MLRQAIWFIRAESCVFSGAWTRGEVFSRELLADGESGLSEAAMKGDEKRLSGAGKAVKRLGGLGSQGLIPSQPAPGAHIANTF